MQYGFSVSRELPGAINLTVGYTGSQGYDMFLRGVGNVARPGDAGAPGSELRPDRLQDRGLRGRRRPRRNLPDRRLRHAPATTRCRSARRGGSASGFTGGFQYQYSRNKGTTQGSNEAATAQNTFDFESEYGTNPQDIPHTVQRLAGLPVPRRGFLDRRLAPRRHRQRAERRAAERDHRAARQRHGEWRDRDQHPRRQQPRHAAAGPGSRRGSRISTRTASAG